jgi:hypothetical protein
MKSISLWIIVLAVVLGLGILWYFTEKQKNDILTAGKNKGKSESKKEVYSGKEKE